MRSRWLAGLLLVAGCTPGPRQFAPGPDNEDAGGANHTADARTTSMLGESGTAPIASLSSSSEPGGSGASASTTLTAPDAASGEPDGASDADSAVNPTGTTDAAPAASASSDAAPEPVASTAPSTLPPNDDAGTAPVDSCPAGYAQDASEVCVPTLTGLTASSGSLSPDFAAGHTSYSLDVSLFTEIVSLLPEAPSGARVFIDGQEIAAGDAWTSDTLDFGDTTLEISVEDGPLRSEYSVTLTRSQPIAYLKASNIGAIDDFGYTVSLSADGSTLAVGAYFEDSNATGVNGDENNNDGGASGAVYVFTRTGASWSQQAYIKARVTDLGDFFGRAVALSADGSTLAVGAYGEDGAGQGAEDTDDSASDSGAAYIFTRTGNVWSQQAYLKASNAGAWDNFGDALSLSADGITLAVGAYAEDSNAPSAEADDSMDGAGAVYIFTKTGSAWSQQGYVKALHTDIADNFGTTLSLSANGGTLAVGARNEDSNATGVGGSATNNSVTDSGAAYIFTRVGGTWSQQAYLKAAHVTDQYEGFGAVVSLSSDGKTLVVGAAGDDSDATGVDGDDNNDNKLNSGAAYVFAKVGNTWSQQAYLKALNADEQDGFGRAVAVSADGNTLVVGAPEEAGGATGVNGDDSDNSLAAAGAAYVFTRSGGTWSPQAYYLKATNSDEHDAFGSSVALSGDGRTLAVGAANEASSNGNPNDNNAGSSGAVYVYH